MKAISIFNNKGGVGKTTVLCNLAAYFQIYLGKKVLVIDGDPQCNTTTYVLDEEQFMNVYYEPTGFTIAVEVRAKYKIEEKCQEARYIKV